MRTIIITGASSGIGGALAGVLADSWHVVLVARRAERLAHVAKLCEQQGGKATTIVADLRDASVVSTIIAKTIAATGRIDALVNNAGVFRTAPVAEQNSQVLADMWQLNVMAPIALARESIPYLAKQGGTIINVSSIAAEATFTGCAAYAASKAAIEAWSRIAREELRAQRIRVGVIVPGATDTEVWPADCPFDRSRMSRPEVVANAIRTMLEQPPESSIDRLVLTPSGGAL